MLSETTYDQHPPDREWGPTVLIVDDEKDERERIELALAELDQAPSIHILQRESIPAAMELLASTPVHVVLLDKNIGENDADPLQNGILSIPQMLDLQPHLQILMVTGSKSIEDVVAAMRSGASGYLLKDMPTELLISNISRSINVASLALDRIRRERKEVTSESSMGGRSAVFQEVIRHAHLLSESNRPVLILGDTGTGKTELGRWINYCRGKYLKQKDRPFFAINVATLSEKLAESELFGHERGAFTDAKESRQGLFELAANGTLFLDEIGELPIELQAKLLTVIEEGTFYRVGGKKPFHSRPKLIFATNRDLSKMVAEGRFRKDLLERICGFPIRMPSLSERLEDIPDIARALLPKICRELDVTVNFNDIPEDFIEALSRMPLDGNIRSIRHHLERLLVFAPKDRHGKRLLNKWKSVTGLEPKEHSPTKAKHALTVKDLMTLPLDLVGPDFPGLNPFLDRFTDRILADAMKKFGRNKDIARALNLAESSTSARIRRLQTTNRVALEPPSGGGAL